MKTHKNHKLTRANSVVFQFAISLDQKLTMNVKILPLFVLGVIMATDAICPEGYEGGGMVLCEGEPKWVKAGGGKVKDWSWAFCYPNFESNQECIDVSVEGEGWPSGYSIDDRTCNVYTRNDCRGPYVSVDKWGWFKFPRGDIMSFRCPCRPAAAGVNRR